MTTEAAGTDHRPAPARLRAVLRHPGLIVGAGILLGWAIFLIWLHVRTHHVSADYPDAFEIIGNFLDPWQQGESKFELMVAEFQTLSHNHMVARMLYLMAGTGGTWDFSFVGTMGQLANFLTLAGTFVFIGVHAAREQIAAAWWAATAAVLLWIRPESLMDLTSGWLALEWFYVGMGVAYVAVVARFLERRSGVRTPLVVGAVVAVFGDAAGSAGLLAGVGLAAWWSLRRGRWERRTAIVLAPVGLNVLLSLVLAPWARWTQPPLLDAVGPVAAIKWMLRAVSQSVVQLGDEGWARLGEVFPLPSSRTVVVVLLAGVVVAVVLWLAARVEVSTAATFAIGLIGLGIVNAVGAYISRATVPASEVFALRYVRLFTPILVGAVTLALLHVGRDRVGRRTIALLVGVVAVGALRLVVIQPVDDLMRHYDYVEQRLSAYQPGSYFDLPEEAQEFYMFQFGPVKYRDHEDFVARVLDWQAEHTDFGDG